MKNILLLTLSLSLLSCGIKKELQSVQEQNTQLATQVQELEAKQAELRKQNEVLYEQTQESRRRAAQLIRENERLKSRATNNQYTSNDKIFTVVERMPEFPGGQEKMMEFLAKNIKYPSMAKENGTKGKVYVQFVVEKDGSLTNIKVMRGIGSGCDEQATSAVRRMPKWTPGEQRGKKVRVKYMLPVAFVLR